MLNYKEWCEPPKPPSKLELLITKYNACWIYDIYFWIIHGIWVWLWIEFLFSDFKIQLNQWFDAELIGWILVAVILIGHLVIAGRGLKSDDCKSGWEDKQDNSEWRVNDCAIWYAAQHKYNILKDNLPIDEEANINETKVKTREVIKEFDMSTALGRKNFYAKESMRGKYKKSWGRIQSFIREYNSTTQRRETIYWKKFTWEQSPHNLYSDNWMPIKEARRDGYWEHTGEFKTTTTKQFTDSMSFETAQGGGLLPGMPYETEGRRSFATYYTHYIILDDNKQKTGIEHNWYNDGLGKRYVVYSHEHKIAWAYGYQDQIPECKKDLELFNKQLITE